MERYYLELWKCIVAVLIIILTSIASVINVKKSRNALKKLEKLSDVALVVTPLLLTYSTYAVMNGFVNTWLQDDTFLHLGRILKQCSLFLTTHWIAIIIVSFCSVGHVPFLLLFPSFKKRLSTKAVMLNLVSYLFAIITTVLCYLIIPFIAEKMIITVNNSSNPVSWSLLYGCVCISQFLGSSDETTRKKDESSTGYYKVSGCHFLTETELHDLLSRGKPTHFREYEERGLGRPITPDDKIENPWIDITRIFDKEQAALDYARKHMNESLDGGHATIEKSSEQFFSKKNSNIIYEIRKENG